MRCSCCVHLFHFLRYFPAIFVLFSRLWHFTISLPHILCVANVLCVCPLPSLTTLYPRPAINSSLSWTFGRDNCTYYSNFRDKYFDCRMSSSSANTARCYGRPGPAIHYGRVYHNFRHSNRISPRASRWRIIPCQMARYPAICPHIEMNKRPDTNTHPRCRHRWPIYIVCMIYTMRMNCQAKKPVLFC